ncbi:hypothetical protein PTKIN_Ptkin12aG0044600 [Pterospermum kingtungense]
MEKELDIEAEAEEYLEATAIFKRANQPVTLKFVDVVYTIKLRKASNLLGKKSSSEEKVILNGVTGIVQPGEMLAMLGPSGSGKTTLLTALEGRLGGLLSGNITYNGKPLSNSMKRITGFVTQDDVLHPHLTVTETLVFTAVLQLLNSFSKEEKIMHAEVVITQLGVTQCKNSIIGDPLLRGASGGEQRGVSIGQEMLINLSFLLLDEPTSGLDSTTAQRIVSTLLELAKEGNALYFGQEMAAMDYFSSIRYSPSVAMNPSDFLLDLSNGVPSNESLKEQTLVKNTLISAYKTNIAEKPKDELQEVSSQPLDQLESNCTPLRFFRIVKLFPRIPSNFHLPSGTNDSREIQVIRHVQAFIVLHVKNNC